MTLIKCPECGHDVSSAAKSCPHCGFSIAMAANDVIRIKIGPNPSVPGAIVTIKKFGTDRKLASVPSGSVAEIQSTGDVKISFHGMTSMPMLIADVSPKNGGKYRATWGPGLFSPRMATCSKVDVIDS